jgi:hypothetical protein
MGDGSVKMRPAAWPGHQAGCPGWNNRLILDSAILIWKLGSDEKARWT